MGIEFTDGRKMKYLFLNVYMPFDSYENYDSFLHYQGKIASIFSSSAGHLVYVIGDYNGHIKGGETNEKGSRKFGKELVSACEDNGFVISDMVFLANKQDPFTFVSEVHHTTSWLDHCVSNVVGHNNILTMDVLYSYGGSDHLPLFMSTKCCMQTESVTDCFNTSKPHIKWSKLSDSDLNKYQNCTNRYLKSCLAELSQCINL